LIFIWSRAFGAVCELCSCINVTCDQPGKMHGRECFVVFAV
jgi:hypothetical protein